MLRSRSSSSSSGSGLKTNFREGARRTRASRHNRGNEDLNFLNNKKLTDFITGLRTVKYLVCV